MADKDEEQPGKDEEEPTEERPAPEPVQTPPLAAPSKAVPLHAPVGPSKAPPPPPPAAPMKGRASKSGAERNWGLERVLVPLVIVGVGMATLWWGSTRAETYQFLLCFLGTALVFGGVGLYMWLAGRTTVPMVVQPASTAAAQGYPTAGAPWVSAGSPAQAATGPGGPWWPSALLNAAASRSAAFSATLSVIAVLLAGSGLAIGLEAKTTSGQMDAGFTDVSRLAGAGTHAEAQVEKAQVAQYRLIAAEQQGVLLGLRTLDARVRLLEQTVTGLQGQNVANLKAAKENLAALQQYQEELGARAEEVVQRLEQEERDAITSSRDALNELKEAVPTDKAELRAHIEALKEAIQQSAMTKRPELIPMAPSARVQQAQHAAKGAQL
jgi:hypothetical protein